MTIFRRFFSKLVSNDALIRTISNRIIVRHINGGEDNWFSDDEDDETLMNNLKLTTRSFRLASDPHQVYVVQPFIKWGPKTNKLTTPRLKLDEAVALIESLPDWKVVDTKLASLSNFDSNEFFKNVQIEEILEKLNSERSISAVFVNVKNLQLPQHLFLEETFRIPVFDRHSIVVNIFKKRAKTKEAKLQVALAEIPYFWSRIKGINEGETFEVADVGIASGGTFEEKRLQILRRREKAIKRSIDKLRQNRQLLRSKREELKLPTVAVVGYTNAGKTSLIKMLSRSVKLEPDDRLFATLDVTVHGVKLPSNLKILLVDTIGFISDVPTNLLEPFVATLEDALRADVIVHVQDLSHPNRLAQERTVMKTLSDLSLPRRLLDTIITVGNKVDKVKSKTLPEGVLPVSCKTGVGLDEFLAVLEERVHDNVGLKRMKIKVSSGGEEYLWLRKEANVFSAEQDNENLQLIILGVAITEAKLNKFKSKFIFRKRKD